MDPPYPIRNTAGKVLAMFQIRWIHKYLVSWTPILNSEIQIRGPGCKIQSLTFNQRFKEVLEQKFNILQNSDDISVPILQHIF
jgi:hypothetical protein